MLQRSQGEQRLKRALDLTKRKAVCALHGRLVGWGGEIHLDCTDFGVAEFFLSGPFLNA